MNFQGQKVSSNILNINFKTNQNEKHTLNLLKCFQSGIKYRGSLEHEIFYENGAPYISIESNLCERPLKLLVDTGASLSLISKELVKGDTYKREIQINLYGLVGKEVSIQTEGITYAILRVGNQFLDTTFHIINGKYTGHGDGYLGYDFLSLYKTSINLEKMKIYIKIEDTIQRTIKLPEKEENFLKDLAENFEFMEPEKEIKQKANNKYGRQKHNKTSGFFIKQLKNKNEMEVHKIEPVKAVFNQICVNNNRTRAEQIFEKLNLDHCNEEEKSFVRKICHDFPMQFYLKGDMLGATDIVQHRIKLIPNAKPVNLRQYRIPETQRRILDEIVQDFERQGLIEKCRSQWNSPAILVRKKDEQGNYSDYRFVVDYRKVNEVTEAENFPIPHIDDIINDLNGCKYFTTLDLKGAFHQIIVAEECRDYTAFTARGLKYRFKRMPMGLSSAPLTWQLAVTLLLMDYIGKGLHVFLDDCIIFDKDKEAHDARLIAVMKIFRENRIQLKIKKCAFYARSFIYLGHIISENGIKPNPQKIHVIKYYPRPTTVKELQSFLGLSSYFRRYVKNFSQICKPLTVLLKKGRPFIWTEQQQIAMDKLKKALTEDIILSFPNFEELFYVTTDASNVAIGAMLSQGEPPNDRPIFYFSKTLNAAQKGYSVIERELLAVVESFKALRVYLYGRTFVLITDHRALCYLFNMKDCGSRLFRQKLELSDYNFKIIYRPGAQNKVADALSRIEPMSIEEMMENEKKMEEERGGKREEKCFVTTRQQARSELDQGIQNLKLLIEERQGTILRKSSHDLIFHLVPLENDTLKEKLTNKFGIINFSGDWHIHNKIHFIRSISNQFGSSDNVEKTQECIEQILQKTDENKAKNIAVNIDFDNVRHYLHFKRIFLDVFAFKDIQAIFYLNKIIDLVEKDDINTILHLYHNSLLGGHAGRDKMMKTISRFYKWNNMQNDIAEFVKKCIVCQKTKTTTNTRMPMEISSLGEKLFDAVYIDFVGPIAKSSEDFIYIFTGICDLTRLLIAVPTRNCTALTAAECLLEHILCRYNFPSRIISDNASNFQSQIIKELCKLCNIKKIFTTPYHPQANIVERTHRTLNSYLRAFTEKNRDNWHELLKFATFVYNNTVHTTTGFTPHELAHGFRVQIPTHLNKPKIIYNYDNFADITRNQIADALETAKKHLYEKKWQNKNYYDKKLNEIDFKIDDMVLIKNQSKKHKFDEVFEGPYRLIDISDSYVEILKGTRKMKIHKNLIKKVENPVDLSSCE